MKLIKENGDRMNELLNQLEMRLSDTKVLKQLGISLLQFNGRIVYEEEDRIIECLIYRKGKKEFKARLLVHDENSVRSISSKEMGEDFIQREYLFQILYTIAATFFEYLENDKAKQTFQQCVDFFKSLQEIGEQQKHSFFNQQNITYFNETMDHLLSIIHIAEDSKEKTLWRNGDYLKFDEKYLVKILERLHTCYILSMKLVELPFFEARELIHTQKMKFMTGIEWRWFRWKLYAFWHDRYFYLFTRWKTNPDNYQQMYKKLFNETKERLAFLYSIQETKNDFIIEFTDEKLQLNLTEKDRKEV